MLRVLTTLLCCAAAQAATVSTTLTINGTVAVSTTAYTVTGTATLSGGISGSGAFSSNIPLSSLTSANASAPFTITLSGGTLQGTLTFPIAILSTGSGSGSATITSASGSYSGDTGSFPSLTGSGGIGSTGNITLGFTGTGTIATGGTVIPPSPIITAVLDAASNTVNLAQGTIFIVKGTTLCPGTTLTAFSAPNRPTTSPDGVQITFTPTAGGAGTNALIWYEDPLSGGACQLAGILPSSVAVGTYNVTVTNGTVSAPVQTQVMAHKFNLFTQDSTGSGLAVVQNVVSAAEYDINRLTTGAINGITISPAYGSEYMVAYGTGMGGAAGDDNAASPDYNFLANGVTVNVIVGGVTVPAQYAGRAGYAGEDQVNFQLPANVPASCTTTLQVSVNGVLSAPTTIAIAPNATAGACVLPGYSTAQLKSLDQGGTITSGGFSISQIAETEPTYGTVKIDSVGGSFTQVSGFQLGSLPVSYSSITTGSCTVIQVSGTSGNLSVSGSATALDAGQLTLTGPSGSNLTNTVLTDTNNAYDVTLGEEGLTGVPGVPNGVIVAGKYTLAGAGGKDVGSFNTSINIGTPLTVTGGLPTTVTRSQGFTLGWTGQNSTDNVEIIGYAGTTSGSGASAVTTATEFICTTTAGAGTFTVPASVTSQLPQVLASTANGTGFLEIASGPTPTAFSPTLASADGGGTIASTFSAQVSTGTSVIYQ